LINAQYLLSAIAIMLREVLGTSGFWMIALHKGDDNVTHGRRNLFDLLALWCDGLDSISIIDAERI
jgi:hypothetical protein